MDDDAQTMSAPAKRPRTPINGVVLGYDAGGAAGDSSVIALHVGREIAIWLGLTGRAHPVAVTLTPEDGYSLMVAEDGPFEAKRQRNGSYLVLIVGAFGVVPPQVVARCAVSRGGDGSRSISFPLANAMGGE